MDKRINPQAAADVRSLLTRCFCNLCAQHEREACAARLRQDQLEADRLMSDAAELREWAAVMAQRGVR